MCVYVYACARVPLKRYKSVSCHVVSSFLLLLPSGSVFERYKVLTAVLDKEFIFPRAESAELVIIVLRPMSECAASQYIPPSLHSILLHVWYEAFRPVLFLGAAGVPAVVPIIFRPRDDKGASLKTRLLTSCHYSEGCEGTAVPC